MVNVLYIYIYIEKRNLVFFYVLFVMIRLLLKHHSSPLNGETEKQYKSD